MTASKKAIIRPATSSDIPFVAKIHAHYTLNTVITFKTEVTTPEKHLENFENIQAQKLPYLVAVSPSPEECSTDPASASPQIDMAPTEPEVIGYSYVTGFRSGKGGYIHTVELSLFVSPAHLYGGTGTLLLNRLISVLQNPSDNSEYYPNGIRGEDQRVRQVIACMSVNVDSKENGLGLKKWYEGFGFVFSGHLKQVGFKFGKW
jgi:L-amino acid N-acyltransferase YncA